jgi:hypothetical protein
MKKFEPFACDSCGGRVTLRSAPGRTREYRAAVSLSIPNDYEIPTCEQCEETYVSLEEAAELDALQKPKFLEWQETRVSDLISKIRRAHPGLSLRALERICGVTGTYLSHLTGGRNEVGQPLLNYLEVLALHPEEVERRQRCESFDEAYLKSCRVGLTMSREPWSAPRGGYTVPSQDPPTQPIDASKVSA